MKQLVFTILFFSFIASRLLAQSTDRIVVMAQIIDDDTLIIIPLPEYCVSAKLPRKLKAKFRRHSKLVYHVKKVYPYARIAGIKLNEYEDILKAAQSDKERRQLMKQAEDELKAEFEDDLKKLTFKQGLILIKLVDRETGNTSYKLVQELRGKFTAFFWQTFARLFGYNLKVEYDPLGADKEIEDIVVMIENGQI
ncbi:MAG: DUF4294 domain-containing protein [Bacteroidales bacterium]|nr:DUF4294 domain-containing protein [Bacteroidales bacterium]